MADQIQIRRDTAAIWTSVNPILAQGELGVETDTSKFKLGDGTTTWTGLPYLIDAGDYLSASSTNTLTNKTIDIATNTLTGVQSSLVSGTNIKTINEESILGAGNLVISGGGIAPVASFTVDLGAAFPTINWNSTNTQTYGWLVQRTFGVASGVAQFGLVQGGARATSLGGCQGTILPFQVTAANQVVLGTPTVMWTNGSAGNDFSTCSLITDMKSGGFHYSGNIAWPGNGSLTMGWGYGLLNANNTAGTFFNSGTTTSQGIHDHNGQYLGLVDADGFGWRGCNNGYASSDSLTRIHAINYTNPDSPSIDVQNPSANTSTSPVMSFILQSNSSASNTVVSGACHYRNGSNQIVARVFAGSSMSFTDHNSGLNWDEAYRSSQFFGVALSTGNVLIYHGSQTWLYTSQSSRTQVTSTAGAAPGFIITDASFGGQAILPDGTDSWIMLSGPSVNAPYLEKWSINPTTYTWTRNWRTEMPIQFGTTSYLRLIQLPNNRIMLVYKGSNYRVSEYWIFNRSQFPV